MSHVASASVTLMYGHGATLHVASKAIWQQVDGKLSWRFGFAELFRFSLGCA